MLQGILDHFVVFGLAGSGLVMLVVLIAGFRYRGKNAERYSILNHFISELGERGVSQMAAVFNGSLILGGILLMPFILGLSYLLGNPWGWLGAAAGLWAAVSCALVGVFPMNNLTPHIRAAVSFFRGGLVMIALFTLAIFAQPADQRVVPIAANIFGALGIAAFASFLIILRRKPVVDEAGNVLNPQLTPDRPKFWRAAILEWSVFFATIGWFLFVALTLM